MELLTEYLRWDEKKQTAFANSLSKEAKEQWQKLKDKAELIHIPFFVFSLFLPIFLYPAMVFMTGKDRRNRHKEKYPLNLNILPTKPDNEK